MASTTMAKTDTRDTGALAHPPIVSREEWRRVRVDLLELEKEQMRFRDALNARRRRLPMVPVEADYRFVDGDGEHTLADLFDGERQLIVYHFMFGPDWKRGCPGCTNLMSMYPDMERLRTQNTRFVVVSRAPYAQLAAYRAEQGWTFPWYSSHGSRFNFDFHASHDPADAGSEYNYRPVEMEPGADIGEASGMSVFLRLDDGSVFHTYSSYARGMERVTDPWSLLDLTPYGRQEAWEDSPERWPKLEREHWV